MNVYIGGRLETFKSHYNSLPRENQLDLLRGYYSSSISQVFTGRKFCEFIAHSLIEDGCMSIGSNTFDTLVDQIEIFFQKREKKLYPKWQRDVLAFLEKKIRKNKRNYSSFLSI